jgi:hypothetical protein
LHGIQRFMQLQFAKHLTEKTPDITLVGGKHGLCLMLELVKMILVGKKPLRSPLFTCAQVLWFNSKGPVSSFFGMVYS